MHQKSRIMLPVLAVGSLMAVSMPSFAADLPHQDPGIFVGGGAIYTRLNNDFSSQSFDTDDFDDDRVSWKAFAGYRFTPIFSIEGQYIDFGDAENNGARVEADGWTAALVADIPFKFIQPYVKAGALFWDTDAHARGPLAQISHVSSDGSDFFWGLGARMNVTDNMDLRLEYERYKLNGDAGGDDDFSVDSKIDAISLNVQFNF